MLILQASGVGGNDELLAIRAKRNLNFVLRVLEEFSEIWPAAENNASSLKKIAVEYLGFT